MFGFFRRVLRRADDGSAAGGGASADTTTETATEQAAAEPPATETAKAPEQTQPDAAAPPKDAPPPQAAPEGKMEEKKDTQSAEATVPMSRVVDTELRLAAALAGVPKENLKHVLKLAELEGVDKPGADLPALCDAAVAKVLADLPALGGSGGVGTGASGEHVRMPLKSEEDKIREEIIRGLKG